MGKLTEMRLESRRECRRKEAKIDKFTKHHGFTPNHAYAELANSKTETQIGPRRITHGDSQEFKKSLEKYEGVLGAISDQPDLHGEDWPRFWLEPVDPDDPDSWWRLKEVPAE